MNRRPVLSLVLNMHVPFVRHPDQPWSVEEGRFFETLSETCLPLLQVFDRLDADRLPFRMALVLSPTFCHMLGDELLLQRYLEYLDRQIEFGLREIKRTAGDAELQKLSCLFYDQAVDRRILFTERYEGNLLRVFEYYQKKGRLELITTAATHAFLPFYTGHPEAIQAQLELAVASHYRSFGAHCQGFWLPELGWNTCLGKYLRSYGFIYTIVDTHSMILGNPPPPRGSFYPGKTPSEVFILARDYYAVRDILDPEAGIAADPLYRDCRRDAGYELPVEFLKPFLGPQGNRTPTGFKYWASGGGPGENRLYDPHRAAERVREQARRFLENRLSRLYAAGQLMAEAPLSLCAFDADTFGRHWYEGPQFIEALFREGARHENFYYMTPTEYLFRQSPASFASLVPEFSSWGANGYGEMWLDASNDWIYRHVIRSLERMIELADRFADDSGLKERALNQAAREILLAQGSDWAKMLYQGEGASYARSRIEEALRNFTTIYDALGSNYISTEWLTSLERQHNIFPHINYRIFRHKR
jgi:1,4-alpha-glucan branching enzyme